MNLTFLIRRLFPKPNPGAQLSAIGHAQQKERVRAKAQQIADELQREFPGDFGRRGRA